MSDPRVTARARKPANRGLTAAACAVVVVGMVGMSFAAVPLYRLFCQVTGFGGTTQVATTAPATIGARSVTVRFDSNIASGLGWRFGPKERVMKVRLGEVGETAFLAENRGARPTTGTAAFNVTPAAAGLYFNKIACFCFTEQTLAPGESAEMGLAFFVDPALADDPDLDGITTITLSYTFFPVDADQREPVATAAAPARRGNAL